MRKSHKDKWIPIGVDDSGLYTEYVDWTKFICIMPRKSLSDEWIWGPCYQKQISLYDGMNGTIFKHYLKTEKEVFMFKLKVGT